MFLFQMSTFREDIVETKTLLQELLKRIPQEKVPDENQNNDQDNRQSRVWSRDAVAWRNSMLPQGAEKYANALQWGLHAPCEHKALTRVESTLAEIG